MFRKIFVSFLCGIAFIAPIAAAVSFPDVKSSDWFYRDVQKMVEWGVIRGNDDGTFAPHQNVNRAELSAMWNRYNNYLQTQSPSNGTTTSGFTPDKDEWLELVLAKEINTHTSVWGQRYGTMIWVRNNEVTVTLTEANGEPAISHPDALRSIIEGTVNEVVGRYTWARNYSVTVQVL